MSAAASPPSDLLIRPTTRPEVDSDVGVLQRVMVHRPGSELGRVTSATADALLFDGRVPLREARAEHDRLVAALRAAGAEVTDAETALASALGDLDVRAGLVSALCTRDSGARAWLLGLPAPRLARALVAGVAVDERPITGRASLRRLQGATRWLVRPLPNLMFTRDLFAIVGSGAVRGRMRLPARRPEAALTRVMLTAHDGLRPRRWWADGDVEVEGGDVLPLGDGVVVIGVGERTSLAAARTLARRLLGGGGAREVIAALVPPGGPFHLDLALTMVDRDTLLADLPTVDAMRAVRWRHGGPADRCAGLMDAIEMALGRRPRVIAAAPADHGRGWDRGTNVVAVRPGTVIAYADNRATNRRLERAGIDVWDVPGSSLGRGRGGPRCLTAPLARAALEAS